MNSTFNFFKISFLVSLAIVLWLSSLLLGSCTLFLFNITITTTSVWGFNILFLLLYSLWLLKCEKLFIKQIFCFWFILVAMVFFAGIFVSYFYDFSYDGQMYHGLATYHLSHGWNLFKNYLPYEGVNIYINHYTQGSWIVYTCFYQMIQNFEFAKIVNLLWMIATFGILIKLLNELKIKPWITIICSLLIAFHPVGLNMFLGMYIDGQMAACISILIATLILLYIQPKNKIYQILLVCTLIYLINIKFTGLVFSFYFLGSLGLVTIFKKKFFLHIKNLFIGSIAIAIGVFFIGYSSYVKNFIHHDNLFYPLDVTQNTKGVLGMEPSTFKQQNRIHNFIQATFAKTGYSNYFDKPVAYKFPFMIGKKELERYAFSGVMIGGMGVWFSGIFILTIALLIMSWIVDKNKQRKMYVAIVLLIILFSCFLLEAPWWARYAPQLYLLPFIATIYYHWVFLLKFKIIYVMIFLLVVNSLLIVMPYTYYNFIVTKKQRQQFIELKNTQQKYAVDFRQSEAQRVHFEKYQIPYEKVSSKMFKTIPDTLFRSEVVYVPISSLE